MSAQLLRPVPGTQCDSLARLPTQPWGPSSGHIVPFSVVTRQPVRVPKINYTKISNLHIEGVSEPR